MKSICKSFNSFKILIALLLFTTLVLTGCSSSFTIGSIENSSYSKMSASYYRFSGTKEHTLTVKDGETVDISVDIVTKKGSIDVSIYKDKDDYEYEGQDLATSSFIVALSEPGEYTIKVDADKHKGSYSFQW